MKTVSIVGYALMVTGLLGLIATNSLFSPSPVVIGFQATTAGLMLWARITFGWRSFHAAANPTAGDLVTTGPHQVIRHPICTSVVLFCFAGALAHPSLFATGLAFAILVGGVIRMLLEERLLLARYPGYDDYAARTKCMLPYVF